MWLALGPLKSSTKAMLRAVHALAVAVFGGAAQSQRAIGSRAPLSKYMQLGAWTVSLPSDPRGVPIRVWRHCILVSDKFRDTFMTQNPPVAAVLPVPRLSHLVDIGERNSQDLRSANEAPCDQSSETLLSPSTALRYGLPTVSSSAGLHVSDHNKSLALFCTPAGRHLGAHAPKEEPDMGATDLSQGQRAHRA